MFDNLMSDFYEQKDENGVTNREKIIKNQQVIRRVETTDKGRSFEKVLYKSDGKVFKNGKFIGFGINILNENIYPLENFESYLRNCDLTGKLDLSNQPDLQFVEVYHNRISEIDVKGCPQIKILGVQGNELNKLYVRDLAECKGIDAGSNKLSEIDVSGNGELEELYLNDNKFSGIDISGCPKLKYFYCQNNNLKEIDTRSNPDLIFLNATENPMKKIMSLAPGKNGNLPLQLHADEGGCVGLKYAPEYDAQYKETGRWEQTYYAMPDKGYKFDGWYSPSAELISRKVICEDTYGTSRILYARFSPEILKA